MNFKLISFYSADSDILALDRFLDQPIPEGFRERGRYAADVINYYSQIMVIPEVTDVAKSQIEDFDDRVIQQLSSKSLVRFAEAMQFIPNSSVLLRVMLSSGKNSFLEAIRRGVKFISAALLRNDLHDDDDYRQSMTVREDLMWFLARFEDRLSVFNGEVGGSVGDRKRAGVNQLNQLHVAVLFGDYKKMSNPRLFDLWDQVDAFGYSPLDYAGKRGLAPLPVPPPLTILSESVLTAVHVRKFEQLCEEMQPGQAAKLFSEHTMGVSFARELLTNELDLGLFVKNGYYTLDAFMGVDNMGVHAMINSAFQMAFTGLRVKDGVTFTTEDRRSIYKKIRFCLFYSEYLEDAPEGEHGLYKFFQAKFLSENALIHAIGKENLVTEKDDLIYRNINRFGITYSVDNICAFLLELIRFTGELIFAGGLVSEGKIASVWDGIKISSRMKHAASKFFFDLRNSCAASQRRVRGLNTIVNQQISRGTASPSLSYEQLYKMPPPVFLSWHKEIGWGVFATRKIEKGDLLFAYGGKIAPFIQGSPLNSFGQALSRRLVRVEDAARNFDLYVSDFESQFFFDGLNSRALGALVNHDPEPNIDFQWCSMGSSGGFEFVARAIRPILKNEQICQDYGEDYQIFFPLKPLLGPEGAWPRVDIEVA